LKAEGWDLNPLHLERSEAVAKQILERIPVKPGMNALEYGAGTGITSFILKDYLKEITMVDFSSEMVKIMNGKIESAGVKNLKTIYYDFEKETWSGEKFDLIMTQMVLHHVNDIEGIIRKFYDLLNPEGFLAIADLYPEDGSFHGAGFTGHNGFDPEKLSSLLINAGFKKTKYHKCFTINKKTDDNETREFELFLLVATSGNQDK
jgi:ubiquinone/menaquinone biosynthesis C-methylase UbiE